MNSSVRATAPCFGRDEGRQLRPTRVVVQRSSNASSLEQSLTGKSSPCMNAITSSEEVGSFGTAGIHRTFHMFLFLSHTQQSNTLSQGSAVFTVPEFVSEVHVKLLTICPNV